jgi:hypothetical protein
MVILYPNKTSIPRHQITPITTVRSENAIVGKLRKKNKRIKDVSIIDNTVK